METLTPILHRDGSRPETHTGHMHAVECAIATMHTHLREGLSLEDLAAAAYLSPFHFNRVFRHLIGSPPGEFLTALRFQRARQLLVMTSLSITDVCFEVGYTSTGSFTSRFTQMVGLPPRLFRQRAHEFETLPRVIVEREPALVVDVAPRRALCGHIYAPESFRGTIYVGVFTSPIPQGAPIRCARLNAPGRYEMSNLADGIYYLRAAAFPIASDRLSLLLPGEKLLLGNNPGSLIIRHGQVYGNPDLVLHPPRLTDPPLVMGLPLL
jgi:AraC family transcriptional regulator